MGFGDRLGAAKNWNDKVDEAGDKYNDAKDDLNDNLTDAANTAKDKYGKGTYTGCCVFLHVLSVSASFMICCNVHSEAVQGAVDDAKDNKANDTYQGAVEGVKDNANDAVLGIKKEADDWSMGVKGGAQDTVDGAKAK